MVVTIQIYAFWIVKMCRLLTRYQHFKGSYYHHLQRQRMKSSLLCRQR